MKLAATDHFNNSPPDQIENRSNDTARKDFGNDSVYITEISSCEQKLFFNRNMDIWHYHESAKKTTLFDPIRRITHIEMLCELT